jgi:hypothetical protein
MQTVAKRSGIVVLVLDWPHTLTVPPLATVCAIMQEVFLAFLRNQKINEILVGKADIALSIIRSSPDFKASEERIYKFLTDPTANIVLARTTNRKWLENAFSDRCIAKNVFGQTLVPKALASLRRYPRPDLIVKIQKFIIEAEQDQFVTLVGGGGFEKS